MYRPSGRRLRCMYVRAYVCMYICVYVFIYVCVFDRCIHIGISLSVRDVMIHLHPYACLTDFAVSGNTFMGGLEIGEQ